MFGFGRNRHHAYSTTHRRHHMRLHHKDPNRQAAGYKAALHNPAITSAGRSHAKYELKRMGRGREAHVPLSTRIKHFFGIGRHHNRRRAPRNEYYDNGGYYQSRTTTRRRRY